MQRYSLITIYKNYYIKETDKKFPEHRPQRNKLKITINKENVLLKLYRRIHRVTKTSRDQLSH